MPRKTNKRHAAAEESSDPSAALFTPAGDLHGPPATFAPAAGAPLGTPAALHTAAGAPSGTPAALFTADGGLSDMPSALFTAAATAAAPSPVAPPPVLSTAPARAPLSQAPLTTQRPLSTLLTDLRGRAASQTTPATSASVLAPPRPPLARDYITGAVGGAAPALLTPRDLTAVTTTVTPASLLPSFKAPPSATGAVPKRPVSQEVPASDPAVAYALPPPQNVDVNPVWVTRPISSTAPSREDPSRFQGDAALGGLAHVMSQVAPDGRYDPPARDYSRGPRGGVPPPDYQDTPRSAPKQHPAFGNTSVGTRLFDGGVDGAPGAYNTFTVASGQPTSTLDDPWVNPQAAHAPPAAPDYSGVAPVRARASAQVTQAPQPDSLWADDPWGTPDVLSAPPRQRNVPYGDAAPAPPVPQLAPQHPANQGYSPPCYGAVHDAAPYTSSPFKDSDHWGTQSRAGGYSRPPASMHRSFAGSSDSSISRANTSIWRLRYDGKSVDLENYLAQLDAVSAVRGWDDSEKGALLLASLEGNASRVMSNIPKGCVSYLVISQRLRQMFAPEANVVAYKAQFQCRARGANEGAHEYSLVLRELAHKAYPRMDHESLEQLVLDQFVKGQPTYIRFALASGCHTHLERAVATAIQLEAYARDPAVPTPPATSGNRRDRSANTRAGWGYNQPPAHPRDWPGLEFAPGPQITSAYQTETVEPEAPEDISASLAEVISDMAGLEFSGLATSQATQASVCYFCGDPGHYWMKCPALLRKLRERGFKGSFDYSRGYNRSGNDRPGRPPYGGPPGKNNVQSGNDTRATR